MGISSYGGDPRIVATRAEIERVQAALASVGNLLGDQVEPFDFLSQPFETGLKRIGLSMELPAIQERIQYLLQALGAAANEYFDGEALVAKELTELGLISAPIIAGGLLTLGNDAGLFREHRVSARQVTGPNGEGLSIWRSPATSLADLGQRLSLIKGEGQIVVERFGSRFVAYLPGTQTWNPVAGANPIDFTSNLQAMKGPGLAASERGVQLALAAAGAGATSQIYLVGHSQGGLVAANLALKDSRIKGLVTFGAPISHLAEQLKVPTIAIQHKNDIVPKLGLKANPLAQNMVTVERVMPITLPVAAILEAHEIENYTKTADLADKSQEFGLKRVREQVLAGIGVGGGVGEGSSGFGEALTYKLERID